MKIHLKHRANLGMSLPELMVATSVGMLVMAIVATLFVTSSRSFAAMTNYVGMDARSRNALDRMTMEIRQAGDLVEFSTNRLKFTALGDTNSFLVYDWNSGTRCLTQWKTGDATTNTLLTDCEQLAFSVYNSAFAATTNISQGKGISVNWKCSRTVLGKQNTSEDMQQALIVLRNKPL